MSLLKDGPVRTLADLKSQRRSQRGKRKRRALTELINYLASNTDGLWYRERAGYRRCLTGVGETGKLQCSGRRTIRRPRPGD